MYHIRQARRESGTVQCKMSLEPGLVKCSGRMNSTLQHAGPVSQDQIRAFLKSNVEIEFAGPGRMQIRAWTERVAVAQRHGRCSRA
jgi:hypothetical protein